jgi:4-amino-4-deoxy-L-arabinose transferase-like glycosyltransferase
MRTRASVASVAPLMGVALVLLYSLHDRFDLVASRVVILAALAAAVAGVALRVRAARTAEGHSADARTLRRRTAVAVALFGSTSVLLALVRAILAPRLGVRADLLANLVPPLVGWSVLLLLPIGVAPQSAERGPDTVRAPGLIAVVALAFAAVWFETLARAPFDSIDEVLYGLQAHRFAIGHVTWPLDPALQRFVKLPLMAVTPEGIYGQHPPGYPAILSLFVRLGIPTLCGATLAALATLGPYRLGRRIASPRVGLVAALLLATNALVIRWAATYMSHVAAMTAVCLAAWLLVDATSRADRRRDVESALAGFLLGVAFTVRPVTGLAIGLSLWLALLARRSARSRLRRVTVMLCVGAAIPFAALLAYNAATTGDPLRLGYHATLGQLNDLGFGMRGYILYDRDVRPVVAATPFTPGLALRYEVTAALWPLARDVFPAWWLLPLLALAVVYRARPPWALVAAFGVLPLVNLFYFGNAERMYVELLPFAFVAAALLLRRVGTVEPRAAHALVLFPVGANVVTSATTIAGDARDRTRRPSDSEALSRALRDSVRAAPRILVFVRNPPLSEPLLVGLTPFNYGRFPGPVVVARDLGAENAALACRLPGYRVLVAESATAAREARLVTLSDSSLAVGRCDRPALIPTRPPA